MSYFWWLLEFIRSEAKRVASWVVFPSSLKIKDLFFTTLSPRYAPDIPHFRRNSLFPLIERRQRRVSSSLGHLSTHSEIRTSCDKFGDRLVFRVERRSHLNRLTRSSHSSEYIYYKVIRHGWEIHEWEFRNLNSFFSIFRAQIQFMGVYDSSREVNSILTSFGKVWY